MLICLFCNNPINFFWWHAVPSFKKTELPILSLNRKIVIRHPDLRDEQTLLKTIDGVTEITVSFVKIIFTLTMELIDKSGVSE